MSSEIYNAEGFLRFLYWNFGTRFTLLSISKKIEKKYKNGRKKLILIFCFVRPCMSDTRTHQATAYGAVLSPMCLVTAP